MKRTRTFAIGSIAPLALVLCLTGCMTTEYDLGGLDMPVVANDAGYDGATREAFRHESSQVQWVFGLFGESGPRVADVVRDHAGGAEAVVNFRVRRDTGLVDFLVTHLSLSLVRMRSVEIEGEFVRGGM